MTNAELERTIAEKLEPEPVPAVGPSGGFQGDFIQQSEEGLWLVWPSGVKTPRHFLTDGNAMLALIEAVAAKKFRNLDISISIEVPTTGTNMFWRVDFEEASTSHVSTGQGATLPEAVARAVYALGVAE